MSEEEIQKYINSINAKENKSPLEIILKERNGEIFDYCGCLVPQGIQNPNNVVIFNHEDVNRLLFIGFQDEQEIEYSYTISNLDRKEL